MSFKEQNRPVTNQMVWVSVIVSFWADDVQSTAHGSVSSNSRLEPRDTSHFIFKFVELTRFVSNACCDVVCDREHKAFFDRILPSEIWIRKQRNKQQLLSVITTIFSLT